MAGVLLEPLPRFGEVQPPGDPVKELHAVVFLQFPHRSAHRRLGHIQGFRRPGHVAVIGTHCQENPDMPQCHGLRLQS